MSHVPIKQSLPTFPVFSLCLTLYCQKPLICFLSIGLLVLVIAYRWNPIMCLLRLPPLGFYVFRVYLLQIILSACNKTLFDWYGLLIHLFLLLWTCWYRLLFTNSCLNHLWTLSRSRTVWSYHIVMFSILRNYQTFPVAEPFAFPSACISLQLGNFHSDLTLPVTSTVSTLLTLKHAPALTLISVTCIFPLHVCLFQLYKWCFIILTTLYVWRLSSDSEDRGPSSPSHGCHSKSMYG